MLMTTSCPAESCPNGSPVHLFLLSLVPPDMPAGGYDPYQIAPCDKITWNFGDGSPELVVTGHGNASHTWVEPGNYEIAATLRNATGEITTKLNRVIASSVARIGMNEITVSETASSVNLTFVRAGATDRRASATFRTLVDPYGIDPVLPAVSQEVVFEAGEVTKSVVLPLTDNHVYDGKRLADASWLSATGGTVLTGRPLLWITDDEKQPIIKAEDVRIQEGDSGRTRVTIPVRLSGPLGAYLNLYGALWDASARYPDDYHWLTVGTQIRAGDLEGTIEFDVIGDVQPEVDEQLTFSIGPFGGPPSSPINGPRSTITILNDDVGLTPRRVRALVGETVSFVFYAVDRTDLWRPLRVSSTDPSVVAVPGTFTLPNGAQTAFLPLVMSGEGNATIEVRDGQRIAVADVEVSLPRAIIADQSSLRMAEGTTARVTLSLAPAHTTPVLVMLTGDSKKIRIPASVTIPAGGEITFDVHALSDGGTAIGITTQAAEITGTSVLVDVTPPLKRRRSVR